MAPQALRGWGKYQRRKLCRYTNEYVRVGDNVSAEGGKLRLPKARSPFRLRGLGSVVSSPSGVWGSAPETDAILNISCQMEYIFGSCKISYFLTITSKI